MSLTLKTKSTSAAAGQSGKGARKGHKKKAKKSEGGRSKFILTVGEEGAILIYLRGNVVLRRLFAPSAQPQHTDTMVELMRGHPKVPLYVLCDVIDQQYIRQSFPPVSSLSVQGLVRRRLERDFQPEDIKGYLPLGRDKTGRKEWNYLLISLAKTPLLQSWLDLLLEQPNNLVGIYLLPVEVTHYLEMLHKAFSDEKPKEWKLLVTHNKVSGFRQVVTRNGKLVFTRVTQSLDDSIAAVIAGNIEQEVIGTVEYLRRLGLPDTQSIEAWVMVSQDIAEVLDIKRFAFGAYQVLTPMNIAEALNLEQAALSADRFGDVVLAAAIAKANKPILRLSTSYADKLRQLHQLNLVVLVIGILLALALLGASSWNMIDMLEQKQGSVEFQDKKQQLQPQLQKLKASVDNLNKDVAFKTALVGAMDAYIKTDETPLTFVDALAPLMDETLKVAEIEWQQVTGKPYPVEVRVNIVFAASYKNVAQLRAKAEAFQAMLKSKLPQYAVTHEPYGWETDSSKQAQEISVDVAGQMGGLDTTQRTVKYLFQGPSGNAPKKDAVAGGAP